MVCESWLKCWVESDTSDLLTKVMCSGPSPLLSLGTEQSQGKCLPNQQDFEVVKAYENTEQKK